MSQTDTPRASRGNRLGRGRGRLRHDVEAGERCDKCRQVVAIDDRGRCALGHQVVDPDRAAEILAELAARAAEDEDSQDHEARDDSSEEGSEPDVTIVLPDAELSPAIPALTQNAFTTPSPRLVERMAGGGEGVAAMSASAMAGDADEPAPLPIREVPGSQQPTSAGGPTPSSPAPPATTPSTTSSAATPAAPATTPGAEPAIRWSADATPPAGLRRSHVDAVERRWVPGRVLAGHTLETPSYLPPAATGRRLAQPGDHAMPVMEPLPPLPGPPAPDGPAVARSLFQQLHGPTEEDTGDPTPERQPRQEDTVPLFARAAHLPPELERTPSDRITTELPELDPSTVVPAALDTPTDPPPAVHEEWAVVLPPTSSLPRTGGPRGVTVDDLAPDAPSVLDLQDLPAGPPRVEPTYELEPVTEDTISPRGPLQLAAGTLFLVALVAIAWYLATTL
ncbi:hypothetical protein [Euzebya rosea]|uniref:hypothetical protein n=1 Tax=Euzebya rosea TaxID=2052804 RepID=UPI000DF367B2|nr:hypothetical protein [Euzebya rosea]